MDLTHSKANNAAPILPRPEITVRDEPRSAERLDSTANAMRTALSKPAPGNLNSARESLGYGLPCANCHLYYPAGLDSCPWCNSQERISASVAPPIRRPVAAAEPGRDDAALAREREAFLQQLKSQLTSSAPEVTGAPMMCTLSRQHPEAPETASICRDCYERLQERVDVLEAALHVDLKEAAQIVYDAVWADPSDPAKTYANAAAALLTELRKRAGVSSLLEQFQPRGN
jgi:hypothetical protein